MNVRTFLSILLGTQFLLLGSSAESSQGNSAFTVLVSQVNGIGVVDEVLGGIVSLVANLKYPAGVACDKNGDLYFAERYFGSLGSRSTVVRYSVTDRKKVELLELQGSQATNVIINQENELVWGTSPGGFNGIWKLPLSGTAPSAIQIVSPADLLEVIQGAAPWVHQLVVIEEGSFKGDLLFTAGFASPQGTEAPGKWNLYRLPKDSTSSTGYGKPIKVDLGREERENWFTLSKGRLGGFFVGNWVEGVILEIDSILRPIGIYAEYDNPGMLAFAPDETLYVMKNDFQLVSGVIGIRSNGTRFAIGAGEVLAVSVCEKTDNS